MAIDACNPCASCNGDPGSLVIGGRDQAAATIVRILCPMLTALQALADAQALAAVEDDTLRTLDANNTAVGLAGDFTVIDYQIFNSTAGILYAKLYNKASQPTAADTPEKTLLVPPGSGENVTQLDWDFPLGLWIRGTVGIADADIVSPATNGLIANIGYKINP